MWRDLGCCSRTVVVIKLRRTAALRVTGPGIMMPPFKFEFFQVSESDHASDSDDDHHHDFDNWNVKVDNSERVSCVSIFYILIIFCRSFNNHDGSGTEFQATPQGRRHPS